MAVRAMRRTPGGAAVLRGDGSLALSRCEQPWVALCGSTSRRTGCSMVATGSSGCSAAAAWPPSGVAVTCAWTGRSRSRQLSGEGLRQPMALQRFDREARAVGRLSHPNVVSVYDVGTQDGQPYLVMELVEGPTVATLLADGPLPVADVLAMGSQVCDGLAAAHAAGIIHRDIKPANLIVTPSGVVKICDFGVARLLDPSANPNLTGPAIAWGSPNYMAPEQINGGPIDRRTDLYALGCTMYAMLTGAPPFTGGGTFDILHQHLTSHRSRCACADPRCHRRWRRWSRDLLAKTPDERPSDARVVRARIVAAQADLALAGARAVLLRSAALPAGSGPGDTNRRLHRGATSRPEHWIAHTDDETQTLDSCRGRRRGHRTSRRNHVPADAPDGNGPRRRTGDWAQRLSSDESCSCRGGPADPGSLGRHVTVGHVTVGGAAPAPHSPLLRQLVHRHARIRSPPCARQSVSRSPPEASKRTRPTI